MILVILTAFLAVCGAAKLDRSYLPPPLTAKTAGGSPGAIQAPLEGLPAGSYTNDAQGVVVDAAAPGTRTSGPEPTGLGGPRTSYGSTDSKVGDAAFKGSLTGFGSSGGPNTRIAPGFGSIVGVEENTGGPSIRIAPGFDAIVASEGSDIDKTRASTLKFSNEIGQEQYSYGFETDNGIAIGENGVAVDGIKANGEYSYKGDDGKVYSVSYTADEGGYKPQGSHLPTPPPIPDEIIKSLEQNAKEEAAGVVDDGTYDAQKYNDEGDYTSNNGDGNNNRPSASGSFVNQGKPNAQGIGPQQSGFTTQGQGIQGLGSYGSGNKFTGFGLKDQGSGSFGLQGQHGSPFSQSQLGATPQFGGHSTSPTGPIHGVFHSHTTQNRFGVHPTKPDGSSATAIASSGNGFNSQGLVSPTGTPSLYGQPGLRLPGSSNVNTAYSSAVTTGSGSASAFASTGSGFKNQPSNLTPGSKFGSDSTSGASFPDLATASPVEPSSATASATAQGQGASAQALSTSKPAVERPNFVVPHFSTFGNNAYSQNKQPNAIGGNEYLPPVNIVEPTGQVPDGSNAHASSSGSSPTSATASASVSGKPSFGQPAENSNTFNKVTVGQSTHTADKKQNNLHGSDAVTAASSLGSQQPGFPSQSLFNSEPGKYTPTSNTFSAGQPTQASSSFPSGLSPTKVPATELSTPFESNEPTGSNTEKLPSSAPTQPTIPSYQQPSFGSNFPSNFGQYKPQSPQVVFAQTGSNDASFASSTPKPSLTQQQGSDSSYYYNQPSKPFVTPISQYQTSKFSSSTFGSSAVGSSGQVSNVPQASLSQQGSKYSNTPIVNSVAATPSTQSGQYHGSTDSSYYNGITQATVSSFPSPVPTTSTQFKPQASHFGSKPTTQVGGSSSQPQIGTSANLLTQKPIVQSQSQYGQGPSSQVGNTQTSSQQGTLYEYNKPASVAGEPTSSNTDTQAKPIQTSFGTPGSQFGKPSGSSTYGSSFQQSQTQGSTFGSYPSNQFNQKPQSGQVIGSTSTFQNQFGQSPSAQKPVGASQIGSNYQQTQFGFASGSQFGKKPSIQSGSAFQQTQLGSSATQVGQKPFTSQISGQTNQGTIYEYKKPDVTLTADKEEIVATTSGTSGFSTSQGITTSAVQKTPVSVRPLSISQTGISSQKPQGSSLDSQNSQTLVTSIGGSQTPQKTQFGSQTTQFGQKPQTTFGSGFTSTGQTSDFGKKPIQTGSTFPQSQTSFGSQQTFPFGQKPLTNQVTGFGNTQTGSAFQQNQFGSSSGSKLGQTQQSTQGLGSTGIVQTSQLGKKPYGTTQSGPSFQQIQTQQSQSSIFGSSNQFGQKPQTNQGIGLGGSQLSSSYQHTQSTITTTQVPSISQFGQKPFGGSESTSTSSQNQSGTASESQSIQGQSLSSTSASGGQLAQSTSFGQKPSDSSSATSSSFTQVGGLTGAPQKPQTTQGYQTSFGQKPFTQTGTNFQQQAFGTSNYGQKPQFSFTSSTPSKEQSVQTTQFGQSFGSSQTANQFGSSTDSKFSQNSQTTQGTGLTSGAISQTASSFGQKPFSSSQIGSSVQQNTFSSSGSVFNQKPQTPLGSTFSSGTVSKDQTIQTTQYGLKPFGSSQNSGSTFSQTQFSSTTGTKFGQKPETTGTVSQTATSFGQQPSGVSQIGSYQQSQFGSVSGTQLGQKPFSTQTTSFTSNTPSKGQTVFNTQFNVKPSGSSQPTGSSFSQTQFGSSSQKTQSGISSTSSTTPQVKPISQFGIKPFVSQSSQSNSNQFGSSTDSKLGQNAGSLGQSTQSGQQSSGSVTGFGFSQTQFGSSTGSKFEQKPQSGYGTFSATTVKPVSQSEAQSTQGIQQTQFGSSTDSKLGQNIVSQGQSGQTAQFGQQSSGSVIGSSFTQTQFGSSTGSKFDQKPQSGSGTVTVQPISQYGKKPFGSQFNQGSVQQTQFGSSFGSQPGQTFSYQGQSGQGQFTQKPFGSSQIVGSAFQQTQSGSNVSQFNQKPGTQASSSVFGQSSQSQFGTQAKKPDDTKSPFQTQFGTTTGQKPQTSGGAFATGSGSLSGTQFGLGSKYQSSTFGSQSQKPFSSSLTQTAQQQNTQTFGQFGTHQQKPFGGSQFSFQQSQGQKPFGTSQVVGSAFQQTQSGSTVSQFNQKAGTQSSSSVLSQPSQSQFGTQAKKPDDTQSPFQTQFGTTTGQKPQISASAFATGSGSLSGTQFGLGSKYQSSTFGSQSQKPFDSSLTQTAQQQNTQTSGQFGTYQQKPFGGSQFSFQQSQGQKPFGTSQVVDSTYQKTQSGSTVSQFDQKPGTQPSSSVVGQPSPSQFGTQAKKPDDKQSPFQTQFGTTTGQKHQTSASAFASSSGSLSGTQLGLGSKYQSSTFGSQSQKPFGSSLIQGVKQQNTQTSSQFGTQQQKPVGGSQFTFQQSQGQKPFGSQGSAFQIGQAADQKTQSTQSNIQTSVTSVSAQSLSQTAGSTGSFEGYNYKKPQIGFASGDQKLQSQSSGGSKPISTLSVNSQFNKPVSTVGTPVVTTTQFGVQPTKPTIQFGQPVKPYSTPSTQITIEQLQSALAEKHLGVQPPQSAVVTTQQPSQTGAYTGQPTKQTTFGSTPSTFTSVGTGSVEDSSNQGSSVSTVQAPIPVVEGNKQNSFVGKGEEFGGPRDPPRFDDKTGYHY